MRGGTKESHMTVTAVKIKRPCEFQDLGILEYARALDIQKQLLEKKLLDRTVSDRIFFVQHPAVFTLGRRGGLKNLMVSRDFLKKENIQVIQTDRGGNITFHGPGQAVVYPVMDLKKRKISVPDFVWCLEEMMKLVCNRLNVKADRDERNHGLWVGEKKIGSVGIALKKGISIHGLALNVTLDLTPFSWINPCGLEHIEMTSVAHELYMQKSDGINTGNALSKGSQIFNNTRQLLLEAFSTMFECTLSEVIL